MENREQFSSRAHLGDNITGNNGGKKEGPSLLVRANQPMPLSANSVHQTTRARVISIYWITTHINYVPPINMLVKWKIVDEPLPCASRVFSLPVQCMRIHSLSSHFRETKVLKREREVGSMSSDLDERTNEMTEKSRLCNVAMRDSRQNGEPVPLIKLPSCKSYHHLAATPSSVVVPFNFDRHIILDQQDGAPLWGIICFICSNVFHRLISLSTSSISLPSWVHSISISLSESKLEAPFFPQW